MYRIFITGSTEGLGHAAARTLIEQGHRVVLHARTKMRAAATLADLQGPLVDIVYGDLSKTSETRTLADQVNNLGPMDAVIHNAGVYTVPSRTVTPEGHSTVLAVNVLAPYMLTALITRPARLIYLSSGMHSDATAAALNDLDWERRPWNPSLAYSESKLCVTALAFAIARRWPDVLSNAVDPGWVPTRMGGPNAPDDLELGHLTQTWLAVSTDKSATTSGGYWHHRRKRNPAPDVVDHSFQDRLLDKLTAITGIKL